MANLVAPLQANPELPVFFNVDGVVGAAPAANNREDVLLVQFILKSVGEKPQEKMTPEEIAVFKAVNVTGVCDAPTINAIKLVQRKKHSVNPSIVVDGRVSPARGGTYSYGGGVWTIAIINDLMQDKNTEVWPRIDLMPNCPPEVRAMVKRACVGV